ncbi:MAG: cytochrome P450 [Acidimicrobiales bacterium]
MPPDRVTDWETDFDHTDPQWAADPFPIWDELRSACPVARTERYGGAWLPTRHADVSAIANDTEHFTSRSIIMSTHRPPMELAPSGIAPPISADPPFHGPSRRMLLPIFSPQRIAELEPATRAHCRELVEQLRGRATVDAATEYAQHIPVRVIARMLGLPDDEGDRFRHFVEDVLEGVAEPFEDRIQVFLGLLDYLRPYIEDRTAHPRDDVISYLAHAELDGEPLDPIMVVRTIGLLLIAGIDTTWSAIGASIWHLASTPDDRRRLVREPELLPTAIEELLRAYAPVTMARLVKEDVEFDGCPMKAEDWVLLPFPAANRDPAFFDRADEVLIDRSPNRHAAFGLGIHRCAGSHLARMELRVALEVWLEAFPEFSLSDTATVRWSGGQVRGPRTLPLTIGP